MEELELVRCSIYEYWFRPLGQSPDLAAQDGARRTASERVRNGMLDVGGERVDYALRRSHLQGYELDESTVRSLRTGPLCDDKPPLSVERCEFWKERFSELAADAGSLGLDSAITGRISDFLKSMDAVKE